MRDREEPIRSVSHPSRVPKAPSSQTSHDPQRESLLARRDHRADHGRLLQHRRLGGNDWATELGDRKPKLDGKLPPAPKLAALKEELDCTVADIKAWWEFVGEV